MRWLDFLADGFPSMRWVMLDEAELGSFSLWTAALMSFFEGRCITQGTPIGKRRSVD